jgi:hypothetical protein
VNENIGLRLTIAQTIFVSSNLYIPTEIFKQSWFRQNYNIHAQRARYRHL